ncbi:hypothetical protein EVAR_71702_1 [Eumeta japonica]|uniref:Uncharacterized protein n=1 Tax=Eumeta variegata TaxID=151549 RepID=A0A4C1T351_EUMVA|nr:hypothetical protein EVAR_71702_1 [Eumeta japonica]
MCYWEKLPASLMSLPALNDEAEESEYDEAIVEGAGNLLPLFGHAMQPENFSMYFGRIYPIIVSKLVSKLVTTIMSKQIYSYIPFVAFAAKAKKNEDLESQRAFVYGALSECFGALKVVRVLFSTHSVR